MSKTYNKGEEGPEPDESRYRYSCVVFNLRRASRIVTRRYEDALRPLGMKAFQFTALAALAQNQRIPQRVLSELFGMDSSTVTRNIRTLIQKGWASYQADPHDGRKKHVAITPEGREVFEQAVPIWERMQAETKQLMEGFDWDDELAWLFAVSGEGLSCDD